MACPHSGTSTAPLSRTSAIWRSTASMSSLGLDLDSLPWLELFLGFQVAVQLLHSWLDYRQLKVRLHPGLCTCTPCILHCMSVGTAWFWCL